LPHGASPIPGTRTCRTDHSRGGITRAQARNETRACTRTLLNGVQPPLRLVLMTAATARRSPPCPRPSPLLQPPRRRREIQDCGGQDDAQKPAFPPIHGMPSLIRNIVAPFARRNAGRARGFPPEKQTPAQAGPQSERALSPPGGEKNVDLSASDWRRARSDHGIGRRRRRSGTGGTARQSISRGRWQLHATLTPTVRAVSLAACARRGGATSSARGRTPHRWQRNGR
jgi:hypothetical protein